MIYLAQVLAYLQNFKSSIPTYLVGGIVDRGFSENDVDIVQSKFAYHGASHHRLISLSSISARSVRHLLQ